MLVIFKKKHVDVPRDKYIVQRQSRDGEGGENADRKMGSWLQ